MGKHNYYKNIGINITLLVSSICIIILLAEIGLHLINNSFFGLGDNRPWTIAHPKLLYHTNPKLPNTTLVNGTTLFSPNIDKNSDEYRILVLGDSYTVENPHEEKWPAYMRKILEPLHIKVINSSVSGYSAWQQKIALKILAPEIKPDLVLATWVPNDNMKEFMVVGEGISIPYPGSFTQLHQKGFAPFNSLEIFLIKYSRIYQVLLRWVIPKINTFDDSKTVGPLFLVPPSNLDNHMVKHHLSQLNDIRSLTQEFGADFFHVYFGFLTQNYSFTCKNVKHCQKDNLNFMLQYGPQKYIQNALQVHDDDSLIAIKAQGKPLHPALIWSDFGHFDNYGHRRMAIIILKSILDKLQLSIIEKETVLKIIEEEENWYSAFNTPIANGSFSEGLNLTPYKTDGLIDEPPSYLLARNKSVKIPVSSSDKFHKGKKYYLALDGYSETGKHKIRIYQNGKIIFDEQFNDWSDTRGKKIIPKSVEFIADNTTTDIEIEFIPSPTGETILRSWLVSGGL